MPFCPKCGKWSSEEKAFCPHCGSKLGVARGGPTAPSPRKGRKIITIAFILILIAGIGYTIALYSALQSLKFELAGFGVTSAGLTSATIYFDVKVTNPSWVQVPIPATDFNVYINDVYIGLGSSPPSTVGAYGDYITRISIKIDYLKVGASIASIIISGLKATLKVTGTAHLQLLFITYDYPFTLTRPIF